MQRDRVLSYISKVNFSLDSILLSEEGNGTMQVETNSKHYSTGS